MWNVGDFSYHSAMAMAVYLDLSFCQINDVYTQQRFSPEAGYNATTTTNYYLFAADDDGLSHGSKEMKCKSSSQRRQTYLLIIGFQFQNIAPTLFLVIFVQYNLLFIVSSGLEQSPPFTHNISYDFV